MTFRIDRLREARERLGVSQRELARRCGMSDVQIGRYEKGVVEPTVTNLKQMAQTLNLSSDYLIGLTDDPRGHLGDNVIEGDEHALIEAFRREGQVGVAQWLVEQMKK